MMATSLSSERSGGITSLLDTDLYKLTMQCAVLKYFPDVQVTYHFTNRTPHMRLTHTAYQWLCAQIDHLGTISVSEAEIEWLRKTCPYLTPDYLEYLASFSLRPKEQVSVSFVPLTSDPVVETSLGDLYLNIHGLWKETILYEIPLLALTSEAYFKFVECDWSHDGQLENATHKGLKLIEAGCLFSEFGSRRRRDYQTHDIVLQGLMKAQKEADTNDKGWKGKFSGTSNVHFAMRYGLNPIGTVAHEWFMGIAAIDQDYANANEKALRYWTGTFGPGVLSIALTDTFGTPAFLRAFAKPAAAGWDTSNAEAGGPTYAQIFTGVRQDSGDPLQFLHRMREFYDGQGVREKKTIVFSDSLNIDRCIQYKEATERVGLTPTFGVGTFLTNDFVSLSTQQKSVPLNIVIKISKANGNHAIKLSDDIGKNTGDDGLMRAVKEQVGYVDRSWVGGDEAHRWDK
jgi:nicotinate phosphoribosyltransferase